MPDLTSEASRAQAREEVVQAVAEEIDNETNASTILDGDWLERVSQMVVGRLLGDGSLDALVGLLGYVKAEEVAEEWGYRREPDWGVGHPHTEKTARHLASQHDNGTAMRRTVTRGPWEVVTDAEH